MLFIHFTCCVFVVLFICCTNGWGPINREILFHILSSLFLKWELIFTRMIINQQVTVILILSFYHWDLISTRKWIWDSIHLFTAPAPRAATTMRDLEEELKKLELEEVGVRARSSFFFLISLLWEFLYIHIYILLFLTLSVCYAYVSYIITL